MNSITKIITMFSIIHGMVWCEREKKILGVFSVVNFPNDACASGTTGKNGTCYTSAECSTKGGTNSGTCANSFGVCCIFEKSCGSTVSENSTYFTSTDISTTSTSGTTCNMEVCKSSSSVCQLRLDFDTFTTAGPLTTTTLTGTVPVNGIVDSTGVNRVGNCEDDQFSIVSPGNKNPPTICGTSSGDHMYVDASDSCTTLQYLRSASAASGSTAADFSIKITQVECTSKTKSPIGCTQYHTASSGTINSYNYQSGSGTGTHLGNQNYAICVRPDRGACAICYSAVGTEFAMSTDANAVGLDTVCGTTGVAASNDYIEIPGGVCGPAGDSVFSADRYCGTNGLICPGAIAGAASATAPFNTVCTQSKPFKVNVFTNDYEGAAAATDEGQAVPLNWGFKLDYWMQTACLTLP